MEENAPLASAPAPAGDEPEPAMTEEDRAAFAGGVSDDWKAMAAGLRQRRAEAKKKASVDLPADDYTFDHEEDVCGRRCCLYFAAFVVALALFAGYQFWRWLNPTPVSCSLELVRPQKFKVDVTDFFAPRVSAALQLVLSLRNNNILRSMLLEQCKLTVFDDETGLKLGSAQQGSLVLSPFSTTQVTVALNQLANALPPPEQRRLAAAFLAKKALLLTIVATASSRIPKKGTTASQVSTNSSRRVDLSALAKEPFFQRQYQPEPEATPTEQPKA